MKEKVNIGIDLGGSHVAIGVVTQEGIIIEQHEKDFTVKEKENLIEVAISYIIEIINNFKEKYDFTKLGLGMPGSISNGIVLKSVNLGIKDYNIKVKLEEKTKLEVKVRNDAKCAAIAEYKFGECKKFKNVLFLALGTGIGGAYIYQGKLMEGTVFEGLEIGHMIIKQNGLICRCGKKGCFEKYGSILTLKNKVIEKLGLSYDISGPDLRIEMKNHEEKIEYIIDDYINDLSIGISNLINIFEPDCVIMGGGFARYAYMLLEPLKENLLKTNLLFNNRHNLEINSAQLGNDAGIIGASIM